jgi:hypothetical protein
MLAGGPPGSLRDVTRVFRPGRRRMASGAAAWTNNTVRVMARNISPSATFDLGPATLSVAATKRRVP